MKNEKFTKLKRRIFEIIQPAERGCISSKIFDVAIMTLILPWRDDDDRRIRFVFSPNHDMLTIDKDRLSRKSSLAPIR